MPASPESSTIWPAPAQASRRRSRSRALSAARPTRSVIRRRAASKRLSVTATVLDREGLDRLGKALRRLPAEIGQPEQIADQAAGGAGEDDLSGSRQSLQACGEVGGLACDRLLLRRALADQVADDN